MRVGQISLFCILQICLVAFLVFFIRMEMSSVDNRLIREAGQRIELERKIEAVQNGIISTGRRIDALVVINMDSIGFFAALYEFDERNSGIMGREAIYREYYLVLLEFRIRYVALKASIENTKQQSESLSGISDEKYLESLLATQAEVSDHEHAFSELSARFEKIADNVFSGADDELKKVLLPHRLKLAKDKGDFASGSSVVTRDR